MEQQTRVRVPGLCPELTIPVAGPDRCGEAKG